MSFTVIAGQAPVARGADGRASLISADAIKTPPNSLTVLIISEISPFMARVGEEELAAAERARHNGKKN